MQANLKMANLLNSIKNTFLYIAENQQPLNEI